MPFKEKNIVDFVNQKLARRRIESRKRAIQISNINLCINLPVKKVGGKGTSGLVNQARNVGQESWFRNRNQETGKQKLRKSISQLEKLKTKAHATWGRDFSHCLASYTVVLHLHACQAFVCSKFWGRVVVNRNFFLVIFGSFRICSLSSKAMCPPRALASPPLNKFVQHVGDIRYIMTSLLEFRFRDPCSVSCLSISDVPSYKLDQYSTIYLDRLNPSIKSLFYFSISISDNLINIFIYLQLFSSLPAPNFFLFLHIINISYIVPFMYVMKSNEFDINELQHGLYWQS